MSVDVGKLFKECTAAPYGFPHPRWEVVWERVSTEVEGETAQIDALVEFENLWMDAVGQAMHPVGQRLDSESFSLVSSLPAPEAQRLLGFFEHVAATVQHHLTGVVDLSTRTGLTAYAFTSLDQYYDYVERFCAEGAQITSVGMFIAGISPQFVINKVDRYEMEATAAHEITHYCLNDLPIPLWLNEGLAVTLEAVIMQQPKLSLSADRIQEPRDCWNADTIQQFFGGAAYGNPETSELAYELGRMAVRTLSHDLDAFRDFVKIANYEDGGQAAAHEIYGRGLEGLIEQFFGPGDWTPDPTRM